jgi:NTP pyrophosphatase (non-canonical NTP hydrolase)
MLMNSYQIQARKTAIYPNKGTFYGLLYCALGLGESGEFQGKVKKILRGDKSVEQSREALIDELGDCLWYMANSACELNITLEELAERNLEKLSARKHSGTLQGDGDQR